MAIRAKLPIRIALVNADLKGLPTTIIAAERHPLPSEGEFLSYRLKDAGADVNYKLYNGVAHEFFGMATLISNAKDAQALAASDLNPHFQTSNKAIIIQQPASGRHEFYIRIIHMAAICS